MEIARCYPSRRGYKNQKLPCGPQDICRRPFRTVFAGENKIMLDQAKFREGMAWLAASVNIITTDGAAGRHGFTASAVCSVSDTPPTLLVCMNRNVRSYAAFVRNGVLCVNVLSGGHRVLSRLFSSSQASSDERFGSAAWSVLKTGAPVLDGCVVNFDASISQVLDAGTHDILMCRVEAVRLDHARGGLVWFGRAYHDLCTGTAP
ncbi:flavin reductase [Komagataeibacter rhaeticus]|uniref:flavin reductase n=2 Tax=Komagataeibacter rhaeticus TaxID=215221 RepID=UPI00215DE39D|nr:flavin reductase [Komagataeibacter rhaeticus]